MKASDRLDEIRREALNRIEKAERAYRAALVATALVEAAGLIAFLLLMDFKNRLHLLLLIQAFLIYGTLAMGLVTLGSFLRHGILRILHALDATRNEPAEA